MKKIDSSQKLEKIEKKSEERSWGPPPEQNESQIRRERRGKEEEKGKE